MVDVGEVVPSSRIDNLFFFDNGTDTSTLLRIFEGYWIGLLQRTEAIERLSH